jgi:hypothetical protein
MVTLSGEKFSEEEEERERDFFSRSSARSSRPASVIILDFVLRKGTGVNVNYYSRLTFNVSIFFLLPNSYEEDISVDTSMLK